MMNRILVIRLGSLGDVILTSAPVLNLKLSFPQAHIMYFTKHRFRSIVEQFDGVDEIITLPDTASLKEFVNVLHKLETDNYDAVVDLHGNMRSWFTRKIMGASYIAVYPKRRLERYKFIKKKPLPKIWPHTIDMYNKTVEQLHGQVPAKRPVIIPPALTDIPEDINQLLSSGSPVVIIAPGAAHFNKQYPLERFAEVAGVLHESHDVEIIWALTATDAARLSELGMGKQGNTLVDYPVDKLSAIIARCKVTVANDSGIAHLSSAVGTPVAAIFGPTHPVLGFSPRGLHDKVIEVDEPCRPCSLHGKKPCYRKERFCFTRITPETVVDSVVGILENTAEASPALFVDRDGTLIVNKEYLSDPNDIEFIPQAVEGLKMAKEMGYKIVIVTNQSGVARGYYDEQVVETVNRQLLDLLAASGVTVDAVYYCPHYKDGTVSLYAVTCDCRKPAPGMVEYASLELGIDPRRSWVIGDMHTDVDLARVVGARAVLVRTGHGQQEEQYVKAGRIKDRQLVADDFPAAVRLIKDGIKY